MVILVIITINVREHLIKQLNFPFLYIKMGNITQRYYGTNISAEVTETNELSDNKTSDIPFENPLPLRQSTQIAKYIVALDKAKTDLGRSSVIDKLTTSEVEAVGYMQLGEDYNKAKFLSAMAKCAENSPVSDGDVSNNQESDNDESSIKSVKSGKLTVEQLTPTCGPSDDNGTSVTVGETATNCGVGHINQSSFNDFKEEMKQDNVDNENVGKLQIGLIGEAGADGVNTTSTDYCHRYST
jgi:hypothetical protein